MDASRMNIPKLMYEYCYCNYICMWEIISVVLCYFISVIFIFVINYTWCQKCQHDFLIPDCPFNFSRTDDRTRWIRRFERFRQASGLVEKSEENEVNTLIYMMWDVADDIFQAFKTRQKKYNVVKEKFEKQFMKKRNIIYMYKCAKFNSRRQEDEEAVDMFITALYNLAERCEYTVLCTMTRYEIES